MSDFYVDNISSFSQENNLRSMKTPIVLGVIPLVVAFEILKRYHLCVFFFPLLWVAVRCSHSNKITPTPRQVHIHQFELSK